MCVVVGGGVWWGGQWWVLWMVGVGNGCGGWVWWVVGCWVVGVVVGWVVVYGGVDVGVGGG